LLGKGFGKMAKMRTVPGSEAVGRSLRNAGGAMHPPGRTRWFKREAAIAGPALHAYRRRAGESAACEP
jgi:hypothetical protein